MTRRDWGDLTSFFASPTLLLLQSGFNTTTKQMYNKQQIFIVTQVEETEEVIIDGDRSTRTDRGGGWNAPSRGPIESFSHTFKRQRIGLNTNDLKAQMQNLLSVVNDLFDPDQPNLPTPTDKSLQLEEVTLSVEVNAKGQLSILGTGGELGGSGGITLKFARPKK